MDERFSEIRREELASQKDIIPTYYTVTTSTRRQERRGAVGELGQWDEMDGQVNYKRITEQYNTLTTHREFGIGMRLTRRLYDDDLSGIMRGDRYKPMVRSGIVTRQIDAARFMNFATSNDSRFYTRSEAVALASTAHLTRTTGISTTTGFNNLSTSAFGPTSYRAARLKFRGFKNSEGDAIDNVANGLIGPIDLEPRFTEVIRTERGMDSNFGNVNPEANTATILTSIRFTDANDWALVNLEQMKENMIWFNRVSPEYRSISDFETLQMKHAGYMRYGVMVLDWRWFLFSSVS